MNSLTIVFMKMNYYSAKVLDKSNKDTYNNIRLIT